MRAFVVRVMSGCSGDSSRAKQVQLTAEDAEDAEEKRRQHSCQNTLNSSPSSATSAVIMKLIAREAYDDRLVIAGSMRAARRAGIQHAIAPIAAIVRATMPNVIGSCGAAPNSKPRLTRVPPTA